MMNNSYKGETSQKIFENQDSLKNKIEVAVIGIACKFPGANNYEEFWENLKNGKSSIKEIPKERWNWEEYWGDPQSEKNKINSRWGGFIEDVDAFDLNFFGLSAIEIELMDPQKRIMLELAWNCFEDAGICPSGISGQQVGVFIGVHGMDYKELIDKSMPIEAHYALGIAYSVVANRISYFFNFKGPSIPFDAACASSLYALHSAIHSIQCGECSMALAGGVNLLLTPLRYISFSKMGILSSSGSCRPFDASADGMVRSEGAGLILLKPLDKAIEDGDIIYGVLKGSAINHSGKTYTLSYPNPEAQAEVIIEAHKQAGINPETITYIETHGTGTPKGDPIEFQGLLKAFQRCSADETKNKYPVCGLGSVKSNIGHLESAAGIAGVIKVLLSMKYKQIPGQQNFKNINPNIPIENSQFYIVNKLQDWEPYKGENNQPVQRRAGVSSFGFAGTNAHLIIEEPPIVRKHSDKELPFYLVCISAKTKKALIQKVNDLAQWLDKDEHTNNLINISATLLLGREPFEIRTALVVQDIQELRRKLKEISKNDLAEKYFVDHNSQKREQSQALLLEFGKTLLNEIGISDKIDKQEYYNKLNALAELYVKGYDFDWKILYDSITISRVSLPTYPFSRDRYWVPEADNKKLSNLVSTLHPLLHQNISDFSKQCFSSIFTGEEFFLADHVVNGQKMLPGVAYLEMAIAAIEKTTGHSKGIQLKNAVWLRPIIVTTDPVTINISLYQEDDGIITYEVDTQNNTGLESLMNSQGMAVLNLLPPPPIIDLKALQYECNHGTVSGDQRYSAFNLMGINYGIAHKGIEVIYQGSKQILAKLSLPSSISGTIDQYFLHPCLLDSALQASIGLIMTTIDSTSGENFLNPILPFELEQLDIFNRFTSIMWTWARFSENSAGSDRVQKLDIDLIDQEGTVCVQLKGISFRSTESVFSIDNKTKSVFSFSDQLIGTNTLTPVWDKFRVKMSQTIPLITEKVVIFGKKNEILAVKERYPNAYILEILSTDTIEKLSQKLEGNGIYNHLIWIAPNNSLSSLANDSIIEEQNQGVLHIFRIIKALLRLGYGDKNLDWHVITINSQSINKNDSANPTHASIHGLIGSLSKEYSNWKIRLVDLDVNCKWPFDDIFALPEDYENTLVYRNYQWYCQKLIPVHTPVENEKIYKVSGVYVVIGGAGGIGEVWSEYVIKNYQANVIWIGRREKDAIIQAKIDRLAAIGKAPSYISVDATNLKAFQQAIRKIKEQYSQINGVIHSAIVLTDKSLANMEEGRFKAALSAKVDISVRIAQVFQQESLDFVMFFSSIMSFLKTPGQSNYAAGCTFKDAFALQLSLEWKCPVKIINWGYWGNVGVVASKEYQSRMEKTGLGSIEQQQAMESLEIFLNGPLCQLALFKTTKPLYLEIINHEDEITIYPEALNSILPLNTYSTKNVHITKIEELDEILCKLLICVLQSLGLFKKNQFLKNDIKKTWDTDLYNRWFDETLRILIQKKYLLFNEEHYFLKNALAHPDIIWQEWDQIRKIWLEDSNLQAHVMLVDTTVRALPDILTGKLRSIDIMFPNSSMALVEGIYKQNYISDFFNEILADSLVEYFQKRISQDPSARIRIIEIGAGTGGTTCIVLQKLSHYKEYIEEYCYTDISKAFLIYAEKEYGSEHSYLNCKNFNVEKAIEEQEISADEYDIVIANNVLHATRDIHQTIRNAKAPLKRHGLLLINEISQNSLFTHLTFGLLEGWWLYEDSELRIPGCPGLLPATWQKVLEEEGFSSVFFPVKGPDIGQQIIVAKSDGIVRQNKPAKLVETPLMKNNKTNELKQQVSQPKFQFAQIQDITHKLLKEKSTIYFKQILGDILRMPVNQIDSSLPLEEYGIDSILVVQLTNALKKVLNNVNSTLFFEYQTIDSLVDFFIRTQKDPLAHLIGLNVDEIEKGDIINNTPSLPINDSFNKPSSRFQKLSSRQSEASENVFKTIDIAIIGLSGRYPGATNLQEFWINLKEGKNCITEIPGDRWDWRTYFDEEKGKSGTMYTKWGGFIEDVDKFDPLFFQISPSEAEKMDPQERLFLQEAYCSIQDAGYTPANLSDSRKVGVFVGVMNGYYPSGSNYWSISNRISYLLNFQGPSISVDTACSSSLTAIYLAIESLYNATSEYAIAGGVNLIVDPAHYLNLSSVRMLTSGNQCKSFGDQADGFIDGEGVGAIVLKPLQKAIKEGDHIYGIIKGAMVNAGGKTNGYTVPNPQAHSDLIVQAIKKADVNVESISYIEAHGTGTALGDPIEIAGLTKAFENYTSKKRFCAIGSVKSNIGHCESAAGMAGLTKVLLQLKNNQLVPSLHSKVINPNIDITNTPFIVQQELSEWKRPVIETNGTTKEYPRVAGISSFGAGGANAHVIIEEYIPKVEEPVFTYTLQHPAIIVLSAKSEDRLKEQVKQLLLAIQNGQITEKMLSNVAFTLQVGREVMDERLAVLTISIQELEEKLKNYLETGGNTANIYCGTVKRDQANLALFTSDEDMAKTIEAWLNKGKYSKLMELWVQGFNFDWNKLYVDIKPFRISLPTYPFLKEHYWLSQTTSQLYTIEKESFTIHPLLHQNISDFAEQRFKSTFTGKEFFLTDHLVNGQKVVPGVVFLEMARAAVEQATGYVSEVHSIKLKNIVWINPLMVNDESVDVFISLYPEENEEISCKIFTQSVTGESLIHCKVIATISSIAEAPVLDIKLLQEHCNINILSAGQCYEPYNAMGINYGPSHKGIDSISVGTQQVLAKLSLPSNISGTLDKYIMHPSLLDSALQSTIGLLLHLNKTEQYSPLQLHLPFSIDNIDIYGVFTHDMWALVRNKESNINGIRKFDIDLCDHMGQVCIRIQGFSSRIVSMPENAIILIHPIWKDCVAGQDNSTQFYEKHLVILFNSSNISKKIIEEQLTGVNCLTIKSNENRLESKLQTYICSLFKEIQSILKAKTKGRSLIQVIFQGQQEEQILFGLSGMLQTAHQEEPRFIGQLISITSDDNTENVIKKIIENSQQPNNLQIRYKHGIRQIFEWSELNRSLENSAIPWKREGVYLITGGTGNLGLVFAREIVKQAKGSKLILTGRSLLSYKKKAQIEELKALGATVEYKQVDVTQRIAVEHLMSDIQNKYGNLHGIIHCAGIIRDNFIINKSQEEITEVLSPKVTGILNLDDVSVNQPLDFFILFSSLSAIIGNPGQADYSSANAVMDVFAKYRNDLVASNQRSGHTLSINWPLWKEGGMLVSKETEATLKQKYGLTAMMSSSGIEAFYRAYNSKLNQVAVLAGDTQQLRSIYTEPYSVITAHNREDKTSLVIEKEVNKEKVIHYFKKLLSSVTKLPINRIETNAPFEKYGIDSVLMIQLTTRLEKSFGLLSKTLFFEYQNIGEITNYFIEVYHDRLTELLELEEKVVTSSASVNKQVIGKNSDKSLTSSSLRSRFVSSLPSEKKDQVLEDVAIVGISGRYPQANNIGEYWQNLCDCKDCITEVPKVRWDHNIYFDKDKGKPGKVYCKWGGFIEDIDMFDPLFFNISPREAELMDPQERLFLECVYETIEDAGYTRETMSLLNNSSLEASVGVFVGVMYEEYQLYGIEEQMMGKPIAITGNTSSIANRISYFFNFHGPSIAIDTMCSSSLTAVHLAFESIQKGECELAIAGGVNISIHPNKYILISQMKFASSKGKCESFGQGGDGYVPSEGVGALLLKPLSKATKDGDHIYGVIKGSAINHGGKTNGFTVPNPTAQFAVISQAIKKAKIHPRAITYIEAHGTGTLLGDPVEITGLNKAFQNYTNDKQFCAIGSVKSNIGHSESASGIAGITKVLLQLKYGKLVPSIHSKTLNPNIDFVNSPFKVQQEIAEWKRPVINIDGETKEYPRIAGVSAFGAGGSNAHVIIEEYIEETSKQENEDHNSQIIVLSAKNDERLKEYAKRLISFFDNKNNEDNIFSKIQLLIVKKICDSLKISEKEIDVNQSFSELSQDQYFFSELCSYINEEFNLNLIQNELTAFNTINSLIQNLYVRSKDKFNTYFSKATNWININELAYTMQIGREAMESRLAIVTSSINELIAKLEQYLYGIEDIENLFVGNIKRGTKTNSIFENENGQEFVISLIKNKEYNKLSQLWVSGINFDWNLLYPTKKPKRISLPTYPFEKKHYWISRTSHASPGKQNLKKSSLTGNLDFVSSLQNGLCFKHTLKTDDIIIQDHFVQGQHILPGAGFIEMVHNDAYEVLKNQSFIFSDISLIKTLTVTSKNEVQIIIKKEKDYFQFKISGVESEENVVYSQGIIQLHGELPQKNTEYLNIDEIKSISTYHFNKKKLYSEFESKGIRYGAYFQCLQEAWSNEENALAVFELPEAFENELEHYHYQPSILDGAFQTIGALIFDRPEMHNQVFIPYFIGNVQKLHPLKSKGYTYVSINSLNRYDIKISDASGLVCVRINEVVLKAVKQPLKEFLYIPAWRCIGDLEYNNHDVEENTRQKGKLIIIIYNSYSKNIAKILAEKHEGCKIVEIRLEPTAEHMEIGFDKYLRETNKPDIIYFLNGIYGGNASLEESELFNSPDMGLLSLFRLVKSIDNHGWSNALLQLKVVSNNVFYIKPEDFINPYAGGFSGFLKAAVKEYPLLEISYIDIDINDLTSEDGLVKIASNIKSETYTRESKEIAYRQGKRYTIQLEPLKLKQVETTSFKYGGVYFIIGGAGGIGLEFGKYLSEKVKAKLVLIGRSELNATQQEKISLIESKGGQVLYIQADISNLESMRQALNNAKNAFGTINGVIHSAIILSNKKITETDEDTFQSILSPKVNGSVVLYKVFKEEPLDFMMFFSSTQSFTCDINQSNYAAGCTFKDAFAKYISQHVIYPVKTINWGYWGADIIVREKLLESLNFLKPENHAEFKKRLAVIGFDTISNEEGIEVIEKILGDTVDQLVAIKADDNILKQIGVNLENIKIHSAIVTENSLEYLMMYIENVIVECLKEVLKIEDEVIDPELTFYDYGVDSISAVEIINKINDSLQINLRTTDLFNYSLIKDLKAEINKKFNNEVLNAFRRKNTNYNSENFTILENISIDSPNYHENSTTNNEALQDNQAEILKILKRVEKGEFYAEDAERYFENEGSNLFGGLN